MYASARSRSGLRQLKKGKWSASRMRYHKPFFDRLIPLQERREAILFVPCSPFDDKTALSHQNLVLRRFW